MSEIIIYGMRTDTVTYNLNNKRYTMAEKKVTCQHTCRNTCAMLNEALRKETSLVMFYKSTIEECNMPEVKNFLNNLIDDKSKLILQIIQKLNEIHVRSQVMDGIASSFNNIDG